MHRPPYRGTVHCLLKMLKDGGFAAWFKGLGTKVVHIVLMAAFMFVAYEKIAQVRVMMMMMMMIMI